MLATLDDVCRAGFSVSVAAPPTGSLAEALFARQIDLIPFETFDASGVRLSQERLRERFGHLLARHRPKLLHANSLAMGRLLGPVANEMGVPSLSHLRDIIRLSARAIADLNGHRRLLAVSQATRDYHVAAGLEAEKTHVLYNGVDLDRFRPRAPEGYLHRELDLPSDVLLIGTIGQIGLRKGQDVLVRAATELADVLPHVHYVVVGERWSEKAESRRFEADLRAAADGPLRGRLHLVGLRHDVDRLLNELCLLVHPARQEPLGRVLLEAAASGVAVIASDVGGTGEIFPPGSDTARLVPPDDVPALAGAIRDLITDEPARHRQGESARRRALDAFDARQAAARLIEHYRQLADV